MKFESWKMTVAAFVVLGAHPVVKMKIRHLDRVLMRLPTDVKLSSARNA
jgi:hypothetical protein